MIFATDLDRTIIHSKKFKTDDDVICVERKDDEEISYMTRKAFKMLYYLKHKKDMVIVPVTTRSIEQYKRIRPLQDLPFAIVANGGIILKEGKKLQTWEKLTSEIKKKAKEEYPLIESILEKHKEYLTRTPSIVDDIFFFTKVEDDDVKKEEISKILEEELKETDWTFTIQGVKLYIIPKQISKENALNFLKRYLNELHLVTAGDGKLDIDFINLGEKRIIPEGSEALNYIKDKSKYKIVQEGMKGTEDIFTLVI